MPADHTPPPARPRRPAGTGARALSAWLGRHLGPVGRVLSRATGRAPRPANRLALFVGWVLSCALVTAITLTAVQRVGHEVSSGPSVTSQDNVAQQVAAAQSSIDATRSPHPEATSTPPSVATSSPAPAATTSAPAQPSTPAATTNPPATPHTTKPTKTASQPATPSQSPSTSPTPTTSGSATPSTSASASPSATASPTPSASSNLLTKPEGKIVISCAGDLVTWAGAAANAGYTQTVTWTNKPSAGDPQVDVVFTTTDNKTTVHYRYWCRSGLAVSTPPAGS